MNLKNGKVFTSKFVGTGPSSYKKIIYRAAETQRLRNTGVSSSSHYSDLEDGGNIFLNHRYAPARLQVS
jgi:hypothetical protein